MEISNIKFRNYFLSVIKNIFCNVSNKIILPYYNNLKSFEIDTKEDDKDFVTVADKKTENYIEEMSDHIKIIGEESFLKKTQIYLDENITGLNPIDGTKLYQF